jgi:hypothetical protein
MLSTAERLAGFRVLHLFSPPTLCLPVQLIMRTSVAAPSGA